MNRTLITMMMTVASIVALGACGDNSKEFGIRLFAASPDAIEQGGSAKLLFVVDPPTAHAEINGMDVSGQTELTVTPDVTTTYELSASQGSHHDSQMVTITVGPHNANGLKVETAATTTAGDVLAVTITAITGDGSVAPGYRGTVHVTSSDGQAVLPADVTFDAVDAGVKMVNVTLKTAGLETVTGTDVAHAGTSGTATVTVGAGAAASYQLSTLPAAASAGESLVLTITAMDMFGNVATSYAGSAQLTSTDATDVLPAAGTFTNGVRTVDLAFTRTGSHFATVSEVAATLPSVDTSTVMIGAATPVSIAITGTNPSTTAGASEAFTASLVDLYGNPCTNFTGTVHFTASDSQADVPADYTFSALDAGTHDFAVTFRTAGTDTLTVVDTGSSARGSNAWAVGAAAASTCTASQAPATAPAGSVVGLTVTVRDTFGNLATSYAGTIALTSSDGRAILPGPVTYDPAADAGSHAFSASLLTTGTQQLVATDIATPFQCSVDVAVTPGAPKIVVTLPSDANAGYAVNVGVQVKDIFDNAIPSFAGTVSFTSTDTGTGAVTPAAITFTGSEGGIGNTSGTFVTIGSQTVGASDGGSATGSAACAVHGLVYTGPATGRVRLVANASQSNTQIVQLDLIANEKLEVSTFFGGGPGSFSAGMNLPLDTTRVGAASTLFTAGAALPPGTGTAAAAAAIGASDHVLYAAVSKKRIAGTTFTQGTEVQAGQVFYSVRLKLTQNGGVGPVFDGAQPSPLYRASVRDQYGDDFVNQSDIGIGKLEIR